jgi:hypothetical protein
MIANEEVVKNGRQIPDKVVSGVNSPLEIPVVASVWPENHQIVTLLKCIYLSSSESV